MPAAELSRTAKLTTVWLLIGAAVFLGVQWWQAQQARTRWHSEQDGVVELQRGPDGHFHWPGHVNGIAVDFLVDTGATTTALPAELAQRAGLVAGERVVSATANGTAEGRLARADITLAGGLRAQGQRVVLLPGLPAPLLGMDWLSRLQLSQRGGVLRVEATPAP